MSRDPLVQPAAPCSGVPEALAIGVQPPAPPAPTDPPGAEARCDVSTTAELQRAVQDCRYQDILLRPGIYEPAGLSRDYLHFPQARRLWAVQPGSVVLRFGVSLNEHPGSELNGLVIDLVDAAHAVPVGPPGSGIRAGILYWGGARGVAIHDTQVRGHGATHHGILAGQADGTDIRRVGIEGFLRFGLRVNQSGRMSRPAYVSDVVVRRVGDPAWRQAPECPAPPQTAPPGCYAPGTQEHGIWIGAPARLERAQVRDVWWAGIITGNCTPEGCGAPLSGIQILDADVDRIGVGDGFARAGAGVVFERVTHDAALRRFCVGPEVERGVHAEWNHREPEQSARDLTIATGVISARFAGVFFDSGTRESLLRDLHIQNATWAGVGLNCTVDPATCRTNTLSDLSFGAGVSCNVAHGAYGGPSTCVDR